MKLIVSFVDGNCALVTMYRLLIRGHLLVSWNSPVIYLIAIFNYLSGGCHASVYNSQIM